MRLLIILLGFALVTGRGVAQSSLQLGTGATAIPTDPAALGKVLCEAVDLRSTERVLDVAAGNGNATLAAARRFADVTSTDYVTSLLDNARQRAAAEHLNVTFEQADAEALPSI